MSLPVTKGARITQVGIGVVGVGLLPLMDWFMVHDSEFTLAMWTFVVLPGMCVGIFFNDYASKHRDDPARVRRMWFILMALPTFLTLRNLLQSIDRAMTERPPQ